MSTVKCGYGHGDYYGYGHSKPLTEYHSQKAPASVTTVVTEINGTRVNDKPPYDGAGDVLKKHALLEENAGVYSGHRGCTVQKHGGGAALTHQYKQQQEAEGDSSEESGDDSDCEEEVAYGQHGTGGVHKHGYGEQKAYQHGRGVAGGYGAFRHDSSVENHGYGGGYAAGYDALIESRAAVMHGYGAYGLDVGAMQQKHGHGGQKAYQHGADAGGYDALAHDTTVQKHGYGDHKAYQHGGGAGGYGALHHDSAVQKHGAYGGQKMAYQQGCVDGVGGYDALAVQNQYSYGYRRQRWWPIPYPIIWKP